MKSAQLFAFLSLGLLYLFAHPPSQKLTVVFHRADVQGLLGGVNPTPCRDVIIPN